MSYEAYSGGGYQQPPYPPTNPGYPPAPNAPPNPDSNPGYPPDAKYAPPNPGFVNPDSAYPPPNPGYPPPNSGYPPPNPGYPPPSYPLPDAGYQPNSGYPPAGYPPYQGQGYPPPGPITQPPAMGGGPPPPGVPPMIQPQPIPNAAPGLEYLAAVDQLIIKQKFEMLEAVIGFETANKYSVKNSLGQKVYQATEKNDCCTRNCFGSVRSFHMKIKDLQGNEVIHLYRPLRCTSCCFPCFLQMIQVEAPRDNIIGYVYQEWSLLFPKFTVRDASDNIIFRIEGPFCTASICGDVEFEVISEATGHTVGRISKQWSGLLREAFTDADNYGISFPLDLHVNVKATLMAAAFLIDFMFFEKRTRGNDRPGMLD